MADLQLPACGGDYRRVTSLQNTPRRWRPRGTSCGERWSPFGGGAGRRALRGPAMSVSIVSVALRSIRVDLGVLSSTLNLIGKYTRSDLDQRDTPTRRSIAKGSGVLSERGLTIADAVRRVAGGIGRPASAIDLKFSRYSASSCTAPEHAGTSSTAPNSKPTHNRRPPSCGWICAAALIADVAGHVVAETPPADRRDS
jgi:hypothetical protein